ncbi:MAG: Ig-like domain-containing protein [Acidobacteriota bacterium]
MEATDAQNKPVPGLTVTFSASNASVNPATAITNAFGRASTTVTLAAAGGGGVTATIAAITPVTATLTAGTGTSPTITGVNTAWGSSDIAQNTFIEIKGNNLVPADTAANGVIWSTAPEFLEGRMPTLLGGVSVTVNAKPAFVYFFCSSKTTPGCATDQINVLTPLDETVGPVQVVVTSGSGVTPAYTATKKAIVPTFLLFNPQGYVIATHANYSLLGPTTLFPGASTPATVNETIVTYAIGFGLPTAALTNGSSIQSGVFIETPVCTINSAAAATTMALISPGPLPVEHRDSRWREEWRQ